MNQKLSRSILLILSYCFLVAPLFPQAGSAEQSQQPFFPSTFFTADRMPSTALQALFDVTEIVHDNSLQDIVRKTQISWLRSAGKERWQVAEKFADKKDQSISLFKTLGLLDEVPPSGRRYEHCIIFGGTLSSVMNRLEYMVDLWRRGVRFRKIVFLTGQRMLDPEQDSLELLNQWSYSNPSLRMSVLSQPPPTTETEMMLAAYRALDIPFGIENINLEIVDAPSIVNADGTSTRPTTASTIAIWLVGEQHPGRCLIISSQPYVLYQELVWRTAMPENCQFNCVGAAVRDPYQLSVSTLLDTAARILYQYDLYFQKVSVAKVSQ